MSGYQTHFRFKPGEQVEIIVSGEVGAVIAVMEPVNNEDQFLLRYKAADGGAVERWWEEAALKPVVADEVRVTTGEADGAKSAQAQQAERGIHFLTEVLLRDAPRHIKEKMRNGLREHFETCDCEQCKERRGES